MSYTNMDHAGWVQRNIEAAKKQKPTKREAVAAHREEIGEQHRICYRPAAATAVEVVA